jgi:membrane-bound lytic murein transglycosylase D
VPDDFKYLVLQESALIADAVSVSNAVGFWQFKDFTAVEMGLRVDKEIDERLNIVSSTRAAARYIKKNNFYFNNWLFALQAYQMGAGGAMRSLPKNQSGARSMEITSSTYWYVKKFLAHKIAFENDVKGEGNIKAVAYENNSKKLLADIAKEVSISEEDIKAYNKWAKHGRIPDDRTYAVIIPQIGDAPPVQLPTATIAKAEPKPVDNSDATQVLAERTKINGIKAIKAEAGETPAKLAKRAGVDLGKFLAWNDIKSNSTIEADEYYLLGKKRARGDEAYHQVSEGDDLWKISQRYGVQLNKLRRFNRMTSAERVKPGTTIWLASRKPKSLEREMPDEIIEIDRTATFAWSASPQQAEAPLQGQPTEPPPAEVAQLMDSTISLSMESIADSSQNPFDSTQILQPQSAISAVNDSVEAKQETIVVNPGKQREHIVKVKETLYGIAHLYNVGVMDLVAWNNLNLQDGIKPGQVLKLSELQPIDENLLGRTSIEHEVKNTDTLYGIARKYGVTIKDLMEWNNKKDFSLAIGEKIKIRSK